MVGVNIKLSIEDIDKLKLANQMFGCGDKISSTELVVWAVQMVIATYEHEAK